MMVAMLQKIMQRMKFVFSTMAVGCGGCCRGGAGGGEGRNSFDANADGDGGVCRAAADD